MSPEDAGLVRSVDDCWNRIGIQGDRTCAQLEAHIHCRNCEIYSGAARSLLDAERPPDQLAHWTRHVAKPREQVEQLTESVLIFRSGAERLALPTRRCEEVVSQRTIRSLPYRRDDAVLGLANIRGELVVCFSLAALLGISGAAEPETRRRLLVISGDDARTALQVDDVHGTHRFNSRELERPPAPAGGTGGSAHAGTHIGATLRWRDHTIGVLDERALLTRVSRSLA